MRSVCWLAGVELSLRRLRSSQARVWRGWGRGVRFGGLVICASS
jgi:hypothetical protein